jgi:hypothetical protein
MTGSAKIFRQSPRNIFQRYRLPLCAAVLSLFLGRLFSRRIPSVSTNFLWGDEAGNVFVWNIERRRSCH